MKYRKKALVEALLWNGKNLDDILDFCNGCARYEAMSSGGCSVVLETLESNLELRTRHAASIGDYILKGIRGEVWPVNGEIFAATYEKCEDAPQEIVEAKPEQHTTGQGMPAS